MSEVLNSILLDCGCSFTVCGKKWLNCYTDSLPEITQLVESESSELFELRPR